MRELMSGNEAIARGAWEAGVHYATGYPGTPSTEILENIAHYDDIDSDWSSNEKVAFDIGIGVSLAGKRALVTMKHVGLNVAADSFMVFPYSGCNGGFVVISADDPGMHSSQNEQDNRYFAKFGKVPMLEPASPQEAKDFVPLAFELSERFDTPVLLRTTTRISHAKGAVELGERRAVEPRTYETDIHRFLVPPFARSRRPTVEERLVQLLEFSESFELNRVEEGDPKIGVISSGVAYQYAREVLPDATYLRLTMAFPFPAEKARAFCERFDVVHIIEEGEPFIEEQLRIHGITNIVGKEKIPLMGELNPEIIAHAIEGTPIPKGFGEEISIPARPPMFCLGCPHRGVFYVLKKMMNQDVVAMGDIGCYTLGGLPPYSSLQTCFSMGASVGTAVGFAKGITDEVGPRSVGVIGDGTFLHGGIPGLIDMVYKKSPATLVICDNSTTGMTGQQEHAGTGKALSGEEAPKVDLLQLVKSIGVEFVRTVDPYDLKLLRKTMKEAVKHQGPSVVITEHACLMLPAERAVKRDPIQFEAEDCNKCKLCDDLGCPAIEWSDDAGPIIDEIRCVGCEMCVELCNPNALHGPSPAGA
ncbi:MAG: indolepyruvate ferredoxin oxidoreductase subunit alpha [Deltaproteobacteria bacterium]|nr:indolepyruvate ferredoxin oxidoreductase subunit alpha [Deltaproteobacteria bacterium]